MIFKARSVTFCDSNSNSFSISGCRCSNGLGSRIRGYLISNDSLECITYISPHCIARQRGQWGYTDPIPVGEKSILQKWPISFTQNVQVVLLTPHAEALGYMYWIQNNLPNLRNGVYINSNMASQGNENGQVSWLAVGR